MTRAPVRSGFPALLGAGVLALLAAGSAWAFYAVSLRPLIATVASLAWRAERCRIVSSGVTSSRAGRSSTSYQSGFSYTFPFGGVEYRGGRYDFGASFSSANDDVVGRAVAAHPPGSTAACSVSPWAPEAVLHRRPGRSVFLGVFPLYLLLVCGGGAILLAAFGARFTPLRSCVLAWARRLDPPPAALAGDSVAGASEARERDTLSLLGTNVLWNGMIAVLLTAFLAGAGPAVLSGDGVFVLLALAPFAIVGLRPLILLMALFRNPRPALTLDASALATGDVARVHWRVPGAARLSKVVLTLEGVDRQVTFSSREIAHVSDTEAMTSGSAPLPIAGDERDDSRPGRDGVTWRIRFHGEPRRRLEDLMVLLPDWLARYLSWPAVSECFPMPAAPSAGDLPRGPAT